MSINKDNQWRVAVFSDDINPEEQADYNKLRVR